MLVLGIVLILLAIATAIAVTVNEPATATTITVLGRDFQVSTTQMFVLGLITAAVFLIGLALLLKGLRRGRSRRKELRYARLEGRERVARLEEENRDLQRRLADTGPGREPPGRTAPAAPPGSRETGYAEGYAERGTARERPAARDETAYGEERYGEAPDETAESRPRSFFDRLVSGGRHEGAPRR